MFAEMPTYPELYKIHNLTHYGKYDESHQVDPSHCRPYDEFDGEHGKIHWTEGSFRYLTRSNSYHY